MLLKKYFIVLVIILVHVFSNVTIALTSQERACGLMFHSCKGGKSTSSNCKQMRELVKDLKHSCKNVNKKKVTSAFSCYEKPVGQGLYDSRLPNWLAVSWDLTNPKVFGYCDSPDKIHASNCAIAECVKNGGKRCKPICDRRTGVRLRACRLGVVTYIASNYNYGRIGCGTRWVIEWGKHTVESYARRELNRCIEATESRKSKSADVEICEIMKVWQ